MCTKQNIPRKLVVRVNKFIQDVNVPIDYQEGVPLSEMIPTVTSALKEQTQELFGKN